MERVPLEVFVNFMLATGAERVAVARRYKDRRHEDGRAADFFAPVRAALAGLPPADEVYAKVMSTEDTRQRRIFPALVEGYRTFRAAPEKTWVAPPRAAVPVGDLEIEVAPELGVELKTTGEHLLLACWLSARPVTPKRVTLTTELMLHAFCHMPRPPAYGMLDVGNARVKLAPTRTMKNVRDGARLGLLLRGEAAAFATIYVGI